MIPVVAIVGFRRPGGRSFRLWLPLFLIWLLLLPVILLLAPIVIVILAAARAQPFRTLAALWSFISALGGTLIEIDSGEQTLFIQLY
jgi:hypothetical protein